MLQGLKSNVEDISHIKNHSSYSKHFLRILKMGDANVFVSFIDFLTRSGRAFCFVLEISLSSV